MACAAGAFGLTLDPTRKIARQVGWLNKNAGLLEKISYSDVVEHLSMLDITEAMSILKQLEQQAAQIPNPTEFIVSSAQQAGSSGHYISGPTPKYVPLPRGPGGIDVTGKIARQVSWLNRNCQLAEPLSFEDVKGPLSALDITSAMAILKEVEERATEIPSTNAYVLAAAARQGAVFDGTGAPGGMEVGGPIPAAGLGVQLDPTGKIGRQVAWLNKNVPMVAQISFSDVVEPLSKIDVTIAMAILKEVEQGGGAIPDPTGHVLMSAERAAQEHGTVPLQPVGSPMAGGLVVPLDPTGKIARQVKWLNANIPLQDQLRFNEVVQPLSMLDIKDAMGILKDLEENCAGVKNPTGYVAAAADRAVRTVAAAVGGAPGGVVGMGGRGVAPPGLGPAVGSRLDPTGKISRQVRWLNQNVQLAEPLSFEEVVQPLSMLEITAAMAILKDVEKEGAKIRKPNAYVITAAHKNGAGRVPPMAAAPPPVGYHPPPPVIVGGGYGQAPAGYGAGAADFGMGGGGAGGLDPTGKIGRQITWLNRNAPLAEPISYEELVMPLSMLDIHSAMKILKDVEEQADNIRSPTKFALNAANKALGAAGAGGGYTPVAMGAPRPPSLQLVPPMMAHGPLGPGLGAAAGVGTKRTWTQSAMSPADDEISKQISKMVGRLNNSVPLQEKVSYSDVKEHLERLPMESAIKILKDVESAPHTIKSPTNYVLAAAKRALSGESIPSKRARM